MVETMLSNTILLLLGASTTVWIAFIFYNVYLHPLCTVPGPWLHSASRLPHLINALAGRLPSHILGLHQRYGPVVRIAPDEISFIDKDACKTLHNRKDDAGNVFPKNYDNWPETANYFTHSVFLASNDNHKRIRQALGAAFSERNLSVHDSTIMGNVDRFIDLLKEDALRGSVNIDERFHWLAFDTVAEFVFGESFHCLTSPTHRGWLRALSKSWIFIVVISSMKQLIHIATTLLRPTGLLQSRVDALGILDSKSEALLACATPNKGSEAPTLVSIAQSHLECDKKPSARVTLSRTEIVANAALFTIAGTDTTATVMPTAAYLLLRNPAVLDRLLEQVRSIERESDITPQRAREFPLLTACIQEAMRMHPATPEGLPRVVPVPGKEISGYWIPAKTGVQVSTYAAYRSPMNFQDPDSFIPDRWLVGLTGAPKDAGKDVFHPFSTGPRGCVGQSFAMAEMRLALIKLFWHFDVELCSDEDWLDQRCYMLWEKRQLMVRLIPRG